MSEQPSTSSTGGSAEELIEVSYQGRAVWITVRAPAEGQEPATLEHAVHVLASTPLNNVDKDALGRAVRNPGGRPVQVGEVTPPKGDERNWFVATSPNRLAAFVVPNATPVTEDPDAPVVAPRVSMSAIRKELGERGVTHGILQKALEPFSTPSELNSMVQVAKGEPSVDPRDGRVERAEAVLHLEDGHEPVMREDGSVDHRASIARQFVDEGTVIATHIPPVEGKDGQDIFGNPRPARAPRDQALESLAGQNTEVRGEQLIASIAGRPVERGNRIDVLPVFEVAGDLNYAVGNIEFAGDVIVRGDVLPGFVIKATGSVTVGGMTEHATIHAGGDVNVQGVVGLIEQDDHGEDVEHAPEIVVGGNLNASYLHSIAIEVAGEARIKREVVNCQLVADRVVTESHGRIVGGNTIARLEIECGAVGSHNGVSTHIQLRAKRSDGPAVLRATEAIHAGVKVNLTGAILDVEDDLPPASLWRLEGDVVRLDELATVRDLIALAEATDRRPPQLAGEAIEEDEAPEAA